jgi:hypothetical protein
VPTPTADREAATLSAVEGYTACAGGFTLGQAVRGYMRTVGAEPPEVRYVLLEGYDTVVYLFLPFGATTPSQMVFRWYPGLGRLDAQDERGRLVLQVMRDQCLRG